MRKGNQPEDFQAAAQSTPLDAEEGSGLLIAMDVTPYLASQTGVGVCVGEWVRALAAVSGTGRLRLCAVSARAEAASTLRHAFPGIPLCIRRVPLRFLAPLVDRSRRLRAETIFADSDVYHAGPLLVPAGKKTAIVATVYDLTPIRCPELHLSSNLYTVRQLIRRLERTDLVVVPSNSTARDLEHFEIVPARKVRVIPLATHESFRPDVPGPSQMPPQPGLDREYILAVGALEPRKNLPRLFEAFRLLKDRHHIPHKLAVAGPGGWKDQEIFESVRRLNISDSVVFMGYVPREALRSLYHHAALLVYPSLYEGFGLPPLEAMASGCPVAVSSTSSIPEVVGEAGIYFNPSEMEDIAQAVLRILDSSGLRAKLRELGLAQSKRFSWGKTAEAALGVYREARKLKRSQAPRQA